MELVEEPIRRVLVIDDELDHGEIVGALLRREGYQVELAADARAGLTRAVEEPPDLILIDLWMPLFDGLTVARHLKSDSRTCEVPIIFLSACGDVVANAHGVDLRDYEFLAKPFHAVELLDMVTAALGTD